MTPAQNTAAYIQGFEDGKRVAKIEIKRELQQCKPQFKEFIKWAGAQGYDCAQTCNSDTGEWIVLHPMTADLWKAWQAAHGIGKGEA